MPKLTVKPCANCNTPTTSTHHLKRCGRCKDVNYCNVACQKVDWKAHKLVCNPISDTSAILKEVLFEDGRMEPDQIITMSRDSFVLKPVAPTPELALGYKKMIVFPDEWLASIAHLPVEEQDKARADYATREDEAEEAKMTAEKREAERRVAKIFGEIQQEVNARLAAKDAAKEASKKSGRK